MVKSIQCQSRLQSEFVALPLLWDPRGNSARRQPRTVLRVVNCFGVSKFDVKPHTLPISIIICNLFPTFEEQRAISCWKLRGESSSVCNLGPFSPQTNRAFFTFTTLANPRLLFRYLQKSLNKVLKVFVLSFSIYPQQNYF